MIKKKEKSVYDENGKLLRIDCQCFKKKKISIDTVKEIAQFASCLILFLLAGYGIAGCLVYFMGL